MSRLPFLSLAFALTIGTTLPVLGDPPDASGGATSASGDVSGAGSGSSQASFNTSKTSHPIIQKPDTSDASNSSGAADKDEESGSSYDVQDDTLHRMSTKETLAAGSMGRDEGQLTRKQTRRERVSEVESTKQLKTSGTDPKFQGSLLHSGLTSIDDLGDKASNGAENTETDAVDNDGPRFKAKRLALTEEAANDSKRKKETSHTKAETSPSPSPSATASPAASNR